MVRVNGEDMDIAGKSLLEFIETSDYNKNRIAVDINGDIIPKASYADKILADGDVVEVVSFVGGG